MSRSVTISTCGFGRARGIRRGRGAYAGGARSAVSAAGAGEAVSSSHQTTLPAGSWVGYQSQRALDVQAGTGRRGGQGAEFEGTAERPRVRHRLLPPARW